MLQTPSKTTQTLLSSRIPRDNEHERYHPELEEELKECLFCLQDLLRRRKPEVREQQ